jgi:hypothetical protein
MCREVIAYRDGASAYRGAHGWMHAVVAKEASPLEMYGLG